MPEGHTIRRKVVDQSPYMVGRRLDVSSPNRRFSGGAALLDGRVLEDLDAWGKHLFYFFEGRRVLHVHLGMDGRFRHHRVTPGEVRRPGPGVWVRASSPDLTFDLSSPKKCEVIDVVHQRALVAGLGPDPLRGDDGSAAFPRLAGRRDGIGEALLDQSLVAGIGNVYRAEILFAHGMHPERPAATLTAGEWQDLWGTATRMLEAGVRDRGEIRTVGPRDLKVRDGRQVYVYGQRMCAHCGSPVRRWDLAGRVAYACETCQPPWPAASRPVVSR
ncbi:MAG TPA: DNA-formamidopyrimidine glycosylase family protein [Acidimicrobiales bacterium]|nr:DNA-formamidopyrimidine glycosylase family protein [Acidimicrobiales bacterium]